MKARNIIYKILILSVGSLFAFYLVGLIKEFYLYHSKSSVTLAQEPNFSVKEIKQDNFLIEAEYAYFVNQATFHGKCLFTKPTFLNEISAKQHGELWKKKKWRVFYNAKHPEESTLQKNFPVKKLAQTTLVLLLLIYFLGLNYYLRVVLKTS